VPRALVALALLGLATAAACGLDETSKAAANPLRSPRAPPAMLSGHDLGQDAAPASNMRRVYASGDWNQLRRASGFALFSASDGRPLPTTAAVRGAVNAIVHDGAGGWFLGGWFTHVRGVRCPRFAHLRSDQSVDRRFCLRPNQHVSAVALRGSTLYVGGSFTRIGGKARLRLAAVDARRGTVRAWNPRAIGRSVLDYSVTVTPWVFAIAASPSAIYVGGAFQRIGGATRQNLAALDPRTGRALLWKVELERDPRGAYVFEDVHALALAGSTLYVAGSFFRVAGERRPGLAALDAATGRLRQWTPSIPKENLPENVWAIAPTRSAVYVGLYASSDAGVVALSRRTGRRIWWVRPKVEYSVSYEALAVAGSTLYVGGDFDRLDGRRRSNLAAVDIRTGRMTNWAPKVAEPGGVGALAVGGGKLAVGVRR
jgi:hypothetical protein